MLTLLVVVREIHTKEAGKVIDATDRDQLRDALKRGFDVVSDCLLWTYAPLVTKACVDAGTSHVDLSSDLSTQEIHEIDKTAKDTGATIIPDCGQDPGIDNVVEGYAARKLDKVKKNPHVHC